MRVFPLLVTVIGLALAQEGPFPKDKTVDAAFRFHQKLFLVSGNEYMAIGPDNFEIFIRKRTGSTAIPMDMGIQAAVSWPDRDRIYFYGEDYSYRVDLPIPHTNKAPYAKHREFLQGGGPDAVSYKDGYFFLFKGCEYASQKHTLHILGEPQNVTDLGLPCDLDAAWSTDDYKTMTVLKGDQIWTLTGDEMATGPSNFEDTYRIWSWQLRPSPDDRLIF